VGDAAPLVSVPEAPVPAGGAAEWFEGAGGARLRVAFFPAIGPARGSVVVSPGRTEPIEKYFEVVEELRARGFAVLVHDWRGQGLSQRLLGDRLRGHAVDYKDFLQDYRLMLLAWQDRLPRPWLALAHSMGACLVLLDLVQGESRFAGAVLSAPMLGISTGAAPELVARLVSWSMVASGYASSPVPGLGHDPLGDFFEQEGLTHDRDRYLRYKAQLHACPDLALGGPTWGWLDVALKAVGEFGDPARLGKVAIPVTLVTAELDRLVMNGAARRVADCLPKGRYVEIPGAFHELLIETDDVRAQFWRAFDELADGLISQPRPAGPAQRPGTRGRPRQPSARPRSRSAPLASR
jgi:lysophospholipase